MPETKKTKERLLKFPKGFLWGSATSAYQVEGGITNNDWATCSKTALAASACDHYHRWKEDLKIAKNLNQNAYRFSLEWSRLEPREGEWDDAAFDHYFHVLKFLKDQGFQTFVTLHHLTNPAWIAKQGGWLNRKTAGQFLNYVREVVLSFGQYIDFWITINEPNVYSFMSYLRGIWPPFEKSLLQTYRVYTNLLHAHNLAYELIHAYYPQAKVGFAQNIAFNEPANRKNPLDNLQVKIVDWVSMDFPYQRTKSDFIGLNHYFYNRLKFGSFGNLPPSKTAKLTDSGWEIYPPAIYEVLLKLKRFHRPIYITENGVADASDRKRKSYIASYLREVYWALKRGVPVKGYFYWSLLDNYEWPVSSKESGYEMKFGLVEVNFSDLQRRVRKSAKFYAKVCKTNSLILSR